MNSNTKTGACMIVGLAMMLWGARTADAHFLWLKSSLAEAGTRAVLSFGESARVEDYGLPEKFEEADLWWRAKNDRIHSLTAKRIEGVEGDDRVVLEAPLPSGDPRVLEATCTYGVYGSSLLQYYVKHVVCRSNAELGQFGPSAKLKLDIVPRATKAGLELTVLWDGKPLAEAEVTLDDAAEQVQTGVTDQQGQVVFNQPAEGLVSILAHFSEADGTGEFDHTSYQGIAHYATLTFPFQADVRTVASAATRSEKPLADGQVPPLPEPVASFGAAVLDGWLYVYSGHTGGAHEHSRENLSNHFRRILLGDGKTWQELPMQTPLQGFALVAHGKAIYRIGGMNARNAPDDDDDLYGVNDFARFDPDSKQWAALAALPEPRSSHDAVVIGDKLYVAGGWILNGAEEEVWHTESLVFDLANPDRGWQQLPTQPFERRALAASHWQGQLAVLGGIDSDGEISHHLDLYDPATKKWSLGPDLPGKPMHAFGVSAWNADGKLYVSGMEGVVYGLSKNGVSWQPSGRLKVERFFHRLLPAGPNQLLAIAGASFHAGHLANIETIELTAEDAKPAGAAAPADDESE